MMTTIKKALWFLLFLFTAQFSVSQVNDFGIWYSATMEYKIVKNLELDFDVNLRTYDNASKIEEAFFDIGLTYKFSKYFWAAASYRFTEFNEKNDTFYPRHKWFADLRGKLPLGDFDISARLRFEQRYKTYYKDENDKEPQEHLRIKPKVLYNIPSFPVNPYVSFELFFPVFNETKKNLDKARYIAGFEYNISKQHSIELEYIYERDSYPKLANMNIISVNYNLKF
jgi:hypothetical protein